MTSANVNRGVNNLQASVAITKLKQQISNLQNQIAAQQAIYVKSQAHNMSAMNITNNDYMRNPHDPMNTLQSTFNEMTMKADQQPTYQGTTSSQSRLNQWKLPSLDKDGVGGTLGDNTDFSRAPGTTKSTAHSAMGSLGLQNDGYE